MDTLLKEIENYVTSQKPQTISTEFSAHTVTANTDKSHAGLVQSTCLKKSMYKIVLCKHGEVNVQNPPHGERMVSTGSNGIPTQHRTTQY